METQHKDRAWTIIGSILLLGIFSLGLYEAYKIKQTEHEQLVKVTLKAKIDNATEVRIAGSFNNWQERCCLERVKDSNEWSIQLRLIPGMYEYILVVDGERWVPEQAKGELKDGLGGRNGVLYVNKLGVKQGGGNV